MGCLSTALLVVNNLRDIPGDTEAGKRTLAVRIGDRSTRFLYVALDRARRWCGPVPRRVQRTTPGRARPGVSLFVARRPVVAVLGGACGAALLPVLADTGRVQLVYAVVLSIGLVIAP